MEFLRRNASQLAAMTAEFGGGLARALDSFKPREEPVIVTPPQPPRLSSYKTLHRYLRAIRRQDG